MLMDTKTCIGCFACTVACRAEHASPAGVWLAPVVSREVGRFPDVRRVYLPLMCMHCEQPACVDACPSGAVRRTADGAVVVDGERCLGSGACVVACPYGAMRLARERRYAYGEPTEFERARGDAAPVGTALKCDLCASRVAAGAMPACVEACPTESRVFGDLDDPDGALARRLRDQEVVALGSAGKPKVFYTLDGVREAGAGPEDVRLPKAPQTVWDGRHATEFALLGGGGGLAVVAAAAGGGVGAAAHLAAAAFEASGGLVLISDLGRPLRFPYALRNQRRSWISRGAAADFVLIAASLAAAFWGRGGAGAASLAAGALAAVAGLVAMLYPALAMAAMPRVEEWHGALGPLVSLVDGLSQGAAAFALVDVVAGGDVRLPAAAAAAGAVARLAAVVVYRARTGRMEGRRRLPWRLALIGGVGLALAGGALTLVEGGALAAAGAAATAVGTWTGAWGGRLLALRSGRAAYQPAPGAEVAVPDRRAPTGLAVSG
jgi:Fe-S-cluster-containing dehydrogenase component